MADRTVDPEKPVINDERDWQNERGHNFTFLQPLVVILGVVVVLGIACVVLGNTVPQPTNISAAQRAITSGVGGIAVLLAVFELWRRWFVAPVNSWMVVLEDGKLRKAGTGLRHFRGFTQTVATFASTLQKVPFAATQVTKEMQGVEIQGFAVWSIYRKGDGPVRAMRFLDGLTSAGIALANQSVKDMAESLSRTCVSTLTITQVITSRDLVRDRVRQQMQQVLSGWGLWVETVEITDVKVCSRQLFEDMQAEFRQRTRVEAERIRKETQAALEREELLASVEMEKKKSDAKAERELYSHTKELERQKQELLLSQEAEKIKIETELAKRRAAVQLQEESTALEIKRHEAAIASARLQQELQAAEARAAGSSEIEKTKIALECEKLVGEQAALLTARRLEAEAKMPASAVQIHALDAMVKIYEKIPLHNVTLTHVGGNAQLDTLLPGLVSIWRQLFGDQAAEKEKSR